MKEHDCVVVCSICRRVTHRSTNEDNQAKFEGWARVEVMGHQTHIGFVKTEAYGQAVMFRVDVPQLPQRQYVLESPEYVDGKWTPAGATVLRAASEGHSVLVGAGSIYRILPCTEAAAMRAAEASIRSELKLISLPEAKALAAAAEIDEDPDPDPYGEDRADDQEDDDIPL
jgi:hypothetical protein